MYKIWNVLDTRMKSCSNFSLDHEIQKGYILGVSSPHKLENFHWYHELGALLGFTKQVFASLRSGAVLCNGHFL